jgi:hypothetical protein
MKNLNLFFATVILSIMTLNINAQSLKVISNQTTIPLGSSYWITNTSPFSDANVRLRLHARAEGFNAAFIDYWKNLYFRSGNAGSNVTMMITNDGFVGINGSANPGRVRSCGFMGWSTCSNFRLQVFGNAIANDYYTYSDSSIKENVEPISNVMPSLMKMNPIAYNYKAVKLSMDNPIDSNASDSADVAEHFDSPKPTTDPKRRYGFTAQEVKRIFPNLEEEFTENLGVVNYVGFVPLLVKGVQEQQKTIDTLKGTIDTLHVRILELRQEIENWKGKTLDTTISKTKLFQNNPNPFDNQTTISYYIDENSTVSNATIEVRDIMGTLKSTISLGDITGLGEIQYNRGSLNTGYYIYTLKVNGGIKDSKMFLIEQ